MDDVEAIKALTARDAWSAIAMWLLVAWGWWLDAHRVNRVAPR